MYTCARRHVDLYVYLGIWVFVYMLLGASVYIVYVYLCIEITCM